MKRAKDAELAMLSLGRKNFIFRLKAGTKFQTHLGILLHDDLINQPWGAQVESHLGEIFTLMQPTLHDILLHTPRESQIIFPKDIGTILLRLSVGPGSKVIEAGTGSGALTTALAWSVGGDGHVYSYDRRADMQELARNNLMRVGLEKRTTFRMKDIRLGMEEKDMDALFLDLASPEKYLPHVRSSLSNAGTFGAILPTTNQVSTLLSGLEEHGFTSIDVCETFIRYYKVVPERLRPVDRMVAHTGYLVFARLLLNA